MQVQAEKPSTGAPSADSLIERAAAALIAREPELAGKLPDPIVTAANAQPGVRACEMIARVFDVYADREALGERVCDVVVDPATGRGKVQLRPQFRTFSYREVWERTQALANVWRADPTLEIRPGAMVCVLGFASVDYAVVDLACTHSGVVLVPLQTNLQLKDLATIIAETGPGCFVSSIEHLPRAVGVLMADGNVHNLIVIDYEPRDDDQRERFEAAQASITEAGAAINLVSLTALIERGRTLPVAAPYRDGDERQLGTIFYTSGSTGTPKGVMMPDRGFRLWWGTPGPSFPNITLCYQPLNHALGRLVVINALKAGGTCYFAGKSDMSTLFEDIRLVRPTIFDFVPRIAELVYHDFQSEVARRVARSGTDEGTVSAEVMREMRESYLGGRVISGMIGTAPSQPEVIEFLRECFEIPLPDAYGLTETAAVTTEWRIMRPPVIDYKLRDVPELGYLTTDKPFPRGELLVKTGAAVLGYYKNPVMTAALFDEDGFLKTGDIFEERGPDHVVYIDRRNNVFKLAQGEFVAIARLESIFASGDPLIRQVYLYGNGQRSYLLAVIVPNHDEARALLGHEPTEEELKQLLRGALQEIGRKEGLRSYEMPRELLIEDEPFSNANGLLSSVGKHLRPRLKEKYGARLEQLYDQIQHRQFEEFEELRKGNPRADVAATVAKALEAVLGLTDIDLSARQSFAELGGDSLAAVSLSALLEETFDVEVPVGAILNPAGSLGDLPGFIETALAGGGAGASFAAVHGQAPEGVRAADLVLDRFMDAATLAAVPPRDDRPARTVFLTGANGFLGRHLLLEWLARVVPLGGKVICMLRAEDAAAARARLDQSLAPGNGTAAARLASFGEGSLEMLAGDLALPKLGLDDATFARLADEVDLIVHPAALVNHVLPYRQLFGPNVVGTAELIRLALTSRLKPFDYVSSLAVSYADGGVVVGEDEDVRTASPTRALDDSYANGYSVSKWAGEVLLREAHERFGLPVNVYRSDMILAHSEEAGQINVADMFSRLLFSILVTGLAPASFYVPASDGGKARAHYDGLPVDFTAAAIAGIGSAGHDGYRTLNVVNAHDDGISLDTIVDWIEDAGHAVGRIADYDEWRDRFETALRALPEKQRQASSLALLDQLRRPAQPTNGSEVPTARFKAIVTQLGLGANGEIPHLSRDFISKCLADLRTLDDAGGPALS